MSVLALVQSFSMADNRKVFFLLCQDYFFHFFFMFNEKKLLFYLVKLPVDQVKQRLDELDDSAENQEAIKMAMSQQGTVFEEKNKFQLKKI